MNDDQLFAAAIVAARQSPNRVRRVGAVLVPKSTARTVFACNSFPKGVNDNKQRHAGNGRLIWMEHASTMLPPRTEPPVEAKPDKTLAYRSLSHPGLHAPPGQPTMPGIPFPLYGAPPCMKP